MSAVARSERGVALPLALFALVMLSGLLLVLLNMGAMEPAISANLNDTTRARYLADAGVEFAFDLLVASLDWDVQLRGPDNIAGTADDGQLASGMTLPGLTANSGTFTVTIRNDTQPNDNLLTGQPVVDPGANTDDTNGVVILTSTGTYRGVTRQIQVVMTRIPMNLLEGVNLPGVGTNTSFDGNSFTITGNDTNLDGTPAGGAPGVCPAQGYGIGVADAATELLVQASLNATQKDNVTGRQQDPALAGQGDNTIAPDASLTPAQIEKLVKAAKQRADMSLSHGAGAPQLEYDSIGTTCGADWNSPTCWGTRGRPKIVFVKGDVLGTTDSALMDLKIAGNSSGAGILIIEDGELVLGGNFRWEGAIIITGRNVGLKYGGGGEQTVYGGIVVNQTEAVNPNVEVDARGNAKIIYSCQALNNIRTMRGLHSLTSWREL